MIQRNYYLDKLHAMRDLNLIKVITGARRVGKSTLMLQEVENLEKDGIQNKCIFYLNCERVENHRYHSDYNLLYNDILNVLDISQKCYVFLDEVQQINDFERLIDGLFVVENINLTITGSNAYLLSSDLATLFAGRYVELPVLPFSFSEYKQYFGDELSDNKLFIQYLRYGSFPETANILKLSSDAVEEYLKGIYQSVLQKDILFKNKLHNPLLIDNIAQFLFDTSGSPISVNKVANTLVSNGINVSFPTSEKIVDALEKSYIFYKANRFDVHGKKLLSTGYKYYPIDTGLRNVVLGREMNIDNGRLLESVVYFELLRRSKSVAVGKVGENEIDFVAIDKDGFKTYYQVAWSTMDENTLRRELAPLEKTRDNSYKFLLTMDDWSNISYNGIRKLNVIDWLMGSKK